MNITFCRHCGVCFEVSILKEHITDPDNWDGIPDSWVWEDDYYHPTAPCPVCKERIVLYV